MTSQVRNLCRSQNKMGPSSKYVSSRGGYRDEFPYRGIPRYGGPYRDTYRDIPRNLRVQAQGQVPVYVCK